MDQPRVTLKVRNRAKNGQNDTTPSGPTSQDKHDLDQSVHLDPNPVVCGLLDTVHSTHESEAPTIFQQSYTLAQLQIGGFPDKLCGWLIFGVFLQYSN